MWILEGAQVPLPKEVFPMRKYAKKTVLLEALLQNSLQSFIAL